MSDPKSCCLCGRRVTMGDEGLFVTTDRGAGDERCLVHFRCIEGDGLEVIVRRRHGQDVRCSACEAEGEYTRACLGKD